MRKFTIIMSIGCLLLSLGACGRLLADNNEVEGAFEYRDVYLPEYNKKSNSALDLNDIDEDWGIWGHNLGVVIPEENPSMQAFARVHGAVNEDQFCFSSKKLFDYIVEYINRNYMFSDTMRFAILPNDNGLVCLCSECVHAGNTKGDASPAVFTMIERLAKKFPKHQFFTSYYSTTRGLPDRMLPPNAGVLVSAIEYPLTSVENAQEAEFIALLNQWSEKTDKVYVWDYLNNFDDYFTPSPIFSIMQRRLKLYRDAGVDGVFLNGSGNDYSVFSRLKKTVLSELLKNPDLDWEELLKKYAREFYPTAGKDIAEFMIAQENMIARTGKAIPEYDGVPNEIKIYLPEQQFVDFYNKMVQHKRNAKGPEKVNLERMTDAMALTMLELKRINGDVSGTDKLKERLARLKKDDIEFYNESAWSIDNYLSDYEFMESEANATGNSNLLKGVKLKPITPLDEEYSDISIVTDGLLGIPSNYHNGNLIISADPTFSVAIPRQPGMSKLKVWMVFNPGFKIGLPEEVYISTATGKTKPVVPERPVGSGHSFLEFDVPPGGGDIVLTLVKNPDVKTMAIDEIQAF